MGLVTALRARNPQAAAHSLFLILSASAVVLILLLPLGLARGNAESWPLREVSLTALAVAGAACLLRSVPPRLLDRYVVPALVALAGIGLICMLNLLTRDASAGAQAFYALPVLWAASHLRVAGVVLVTGTALLADGVSLFLLLPAAAALTDLVFFGVVLAITAVLLVRSIGVQERLVAALQQQLTVDALTGLATRRAFDGALETALDRPVPGGTALVLIDVDSFKTINDTHGHPVGDDVLVHLASVLGVRVRAEDAVLSRLGGDELAILMPGCARGVAVHRARDLLKAVRSTPMTLADGTLLALSISIGVAHLPRHSTDRRGLYTAADAALYEAKRAGRDRVSVAAT